MVFDKLCNEAFEKYNIDKNLLLNNLIKREKVIEVIKLKDIEEKKNEK